MQRTASFADFFNCVKKRSRVGILNLGGDTCVLSRIAFSSLCILYEHLYCFIFDMTGIWQIWELGRIEVNGTSGVDMAREGAQQGNRFLLLSRMAVVLLPG